MLRPDFFAGVDGVRRAKGFCVFQFAGLMSIAIKGVLGRGFRPV